MSDYGGAPLYLVRGGRVGRAFGSEPGAAPNAPFAIMRSLATDGVGRIWSAPLTRYEITQWDTAGARVGSWAARIAGFEPWTALRPMGPDHPPDPRLSDIHWLGDDRLIVLVSMPAPDWKEHLGEPTAAPDGGVRYESADNYRIFHTRIDVWDLSDAAILVSRFEPAFIYRVIDDGHLAGYRLDDDGNPFVDIWGFRFDDAR